MAKFSTLDEFTASLPSDQEQAIRRLVDFVAAAYPQFELVIAWNQPMFKHGGKHLFGFMPSKQYINLASMTDTAIDRMGTALAGYRHGKRTISLPFDWQIDPALIDQLIAIRLEETGQSA